MTDTPSWRASVEAMIAKARQHQDEKFYRKTLPGWEQELRSIQRDEGVTTTSTTRNGESSASLRVATTAE